MSVATTAQKHSPMVVKPWRNLKKSIAKIIDENVWYGIYIAAAVTASQIVLLIEPKAGIYVNAAAFAILVALGLWQEKARQLAISAAILPVANMVTLSLPQTNVFAQTMVFYDALLLLGLVYRYMFTLDFPVPLSRLKARGYLLWLPLMVIIGQALGAVGYGMLHNHYIFGNISVAFVAVSAVVFAAAEETFFRGLIQQRAGRLMHGVIAAMLSVLFYTLTSIDHTSILVPIYGLLMGMVLSIVYYKKQNLMLTLVLNASSKLLYIGLMATFVLH